MPRRLLTAASAAILAVSIISSCGESAAQPAVTTELSLNEETVSAETTIYDSLPQADLGGYEFKVLNNISNFATTTFDVTEQTGDILEDAVYIRNRQIESLLNCSISVNEEGWDGVQSMVSKSVQAGEDFADVYFNESHFVIADSLKGYLTDTKELTDVDISQPWWNLAAINSIKVGEPIYCLYGDLHFMYAECYQPVFLNNGMIKDYGLERPYSLVNDGKWTIDKMSEYMTAVTSDIDGDGKMKSSDQFGLGVWAHNTLSFIIGCGMEVVSRNEDNLPYWNGITEEFVAKYTKICDAIFAENNRICRDSTSGINSLPDTLHSMFHDGRCLFFIEPLGSLKKHRDADFEVGVLPLPKYDEQQKDHISYIYHGAAALALPVTCVNTGKVGVILENLCAYSHEDVKAAYYDATLDFKYVNNEESIDMLDIIFSRGSFDISRVYDWGGYSSKICDTLSAGKTDIASAAAKLDSKISAAIEKTLEFYQG
ncbi:MAG: hypothetical protein K6D94_11450 [Clostridiales bacterium]|nr:hypothetical protein [Clostridiales bacterium]